MPLVSLERKESFRNGVNQTKQVLETFGRSMASSGSDAAARVKASFRARAARRRLLQYRHDEDNSTNEAQT